MAITIGTIPDYVATGIAAFRARNPKRRMDTESFYGGNARAVAMCILGFAKSVLDLDNDAVPGPNNSEGGADNWANALGVPSNNPNSPYGRHIAIAAQGGRGTPTGLAGVNIPAGSTLVDSSGQVTVQTTVPVVLNGPPNTTAVSFAAITPGSKGNLSVGTQLTWQPAIPNVDPTVTLTSALTGGKEVESKAELTNRTLFRLQNPPRGGDAADFRFWCENWEFAKVVQTSVKRAYIYPYRGGLGTAHAVVTAGGSGVSRQVADFIGLFPITAWIETYVGTVRPVCSQFRALSPNMLAGNGLDLRLRLIPFSQYDFDWQDGGSAIAIVVPDSTHITVNVNIKTFAGTVTLRDAIDAGKKPRLQIQAANSVLPIIVQAVHYTDAANSVITLAAPSSVTLLGGDTVQAGGSVVLPIAQALLDLVDGLGPSKASGYADPDDAGDATLVNGVRVVRAWDDTLRVNVMKSRALEIVDSDGATRMIKDVLSATINGAETNKQAQDPNILTTAPELLWAKSILVTA